MPANCHRRRLLSSRPGIDGFEDAVALSERLRLHQGHHVAGVCGRACNHLLGAFPTNTSQLFDGGAVEGSIDTQVDTLYHLFVMPNVSNVLRRYPHMVFRRHWDMPPAVYYQLGQCEAIVSAICEMPLRPEYHQVLLNVSLFKGAQATTAIEGNTLTDAEVERVAAGQSLPPSKEYQEREVRNILDVMNLLLRGVAVDRQASLVSPDLIKRLHRLVGKGLGEHFDAFPGEFRQDQRTVGPYRCPRPQDVPILVDHLCSWLQEQFGFRSGQQSFSEAVIQAIVTHVYVEWIHPFGDGNGRTGRLLEFYILLRAGNPDIASHILSNFYNLTRAEYYRQLSKAYSERQLTSFIAYAVQGYRDGLQDSLRTIQDSQFEMAWRALIYDRFAERRYRKKNVFKRRRDLMLAMPTDRELSTEDLFVLTPRLAGEYSNLSGRTLLRDLAVLSEMELITESSGQYKANTGLLRQQMPIRLVGRTAEAVA